MQWSPCPMAVAMFSRAFEKLHRVLAGIDAPDHGLDVTIRMRQRLLTQSYGLVHRFPRGLGCALATALENIATAIGQGHRCILPCLQGEGHPLDFEAVHMLEDVLKEAGKRGGAQREHRGRRRSPTPSLPT